jgi:hypothetical protein
MDKMISWTGPVLKINGELVLMISLAEGGDEFVDCSRSLSEVQGEYLRIVIQEWLPAMLRLDQGDLVCVHKTGGKFHSNAPNPGPRNGSGQIEPQATAGIAERVC